MYKYLLTIIIPILIISCTSKKEDAKLENIPPETLYNDGMAFISERKYKSATETFEKIEGQYPYSKWAGKGKIMTAYANYRAGEYDDAIISLESFIKLYPGSEDTAYAYYLRALCYYERIVDIGRDQKTTRQALESLKEVITRFPESDYARDASLKMDLANDHLAGKEMEVGRFYLKNGKYIAAINRFKKVINDYQTTTHTPEALHRLVEAYLSIGVLAEAQKYAAVLGNNYPSSTWYKYSYELLEPEVVAEKKENTWYKKIF